MIALGIRARLVGMTVVLLAASVASLAAVARSAAERLLRQGVESHATALVESVSRGVAFPLAVDDREGLTRQLRAFADDPDLVLVEVANPAGLVVARTGDRLGGPFVAGSAAPAGRDPAARWIDGPGASRVFECVHPVRAPSAGSDGRVGTVRIAISSVRSEATLRRLDGTLLLAAGLLLAGGLLAAIALGGRLAGPLERLSAAAAVVASGRLDAPLQLTGPGEVGQLARSFHTMTAALRANQQQVRELAERELARARTDWAVTFDAISDPIAIFDARGGFLKANAAFQRRAQRDDVEGEWLSHMASAGPDPAGAQRGAPPTPGSQDTVVGETHFSVSSFPILEPEGAAAGRVLILRDVTERDRLRDQLVQSEKLTALGLLISGVAHEINNPLGGVLGFTELALRREPPQAVRRHLEKILLLANRVRHVVRGLLAYARPRAPERAAVDLNALVGQTLELRSYDHSVSRIEVRAELDPGLDEFWGDPHQIQQLLMNLVINAEQAMRPRGGRLLVRTRRSSDGLAEIVVEDEGPGIRRELLSRIFDPFFTTKPVGEGTGLGLSLVLGIVRDHGGGVAAENRPEGGARFRVTLPIAEAPRADAAPTSTAADHTQGRVIVVVDDEPELLQMVAEALGASGHRVVGQLSVDAAWMTLRRARPDLVLADLRMPGQDGRDLFARLQTDLRLWDVPIAFMTGDLANPDTLRFLAQHGLAALAKPFGIDELCAFVTGQIAQAEKRREREGTDSPAAAGPLA